uniref:Potassium channel domain-containing protein n=1 Tax=Panagrolaimus sp. JU765 TaxID=591449 RepID=A0AC34QTM1_9BILA
MVKVEKVERLDFERAELLNILWAESLIRSESDWSLLANQKLDSYERSLAVSKSIDEIPQPIESFYDGFHHSFLLLTTIGSIDTDDLSIEAKIFSIFYSIFGIPLVMLYLNQCVKAISSFWQGFEVYAFFAGFIFVVAILYDVIEQTSDDTPFFEAIFSVFLAVTTIGEEDNQLPRFLLYFIAIAGIGTFHVCIFILQRQIEKRLQAFELDFSQQVARLLRFFNDEKNDGRIIEEDEEALEEEEYST